MSEHTRTPARLSILNPTTFSPFVATNGVIVKDDILRAIIGTGITLSAFYFADELWPRRDRNLIKPISSLDSLFHNSTTRRPSYGPPNHQSIQWLDPADYVPPKMDLFSDDPIPFTRSSPPLCPIDSEHLERAFETLKYKHAVKTLGVPSVVNRGVRIITCPMSLGGTSSSTEWDDPFLGGFGSLSLLSFEQGSRGSDADDEGSGDDDPNDEGSADDRGDDEGSDYSYRGDIDHDDSDISERDCLPYIYGNFDSAPPPPPPPPSDGADPELDDDAGFSSLFVWPSLACGCLSGLLLKLYLSLKRRKLEASKLYPKATVSDSFNQTSNTALSVPLGSAPVIVGLLRDPAEATDLGALLDSYCLLQFDSNSTDVYKPVFDDSDMATVPLSVSWLQASKLVVDAFFAKLPLFGVGCVKMVAVILALVFCVSLQIVIFGSTGRVRRRGFYSLLKQIFGWKLPRRTPEPAETTTTTVDNCDTRDDGSVEAAEASALVNNSELEKVAVPAVMNPVVDSDLERQYRILDTLSNRTLSGSIWASQAPIVPAPHYNIPNDFATASTSTKQGDHVLVQPLRNSVSTPTTHTHSDRTLSGSIWAPIVPAPPLKIPTSKSDDALVQPSSNSVSTPTTPTTPSKSSKKARRRRARKRADQELSSKDSASDAGSDVPNWANA